MQIYKIFLKLCFKNTGSSLFYFIAFVSLSLIMANTSTTSEITSFTPSQIDVAVVDYDQSNLSQSIYSYLEDTQSMHDITFENEDWRDDLFYRNINYILIINRGFQENFTNDANDIYLTSYTNPSSNTAFIVENQVNTILTNISYYIESGYTYEDAISNAINTSSITASTSLLQSDVTIQSPGPMTYFFNYVPYMMICIVINTIGPMLFVWNKHDIKSRIFISSVSFSKRNLALTGAMLTYAGFLYFAFLTISAVIFTDDFFTIRGLYFSLNAFIYLLVCLSICYLVVQLSHKPSALTMWSNGIGLSTSFLCGLFVPRELLPDAVVHFSKCLPTAWYINITEELAYFQGSLSSFAYKSIFVQLLFALAIYIIALVVIKNKQQHQ